MTEAPANNIPQEWKDEPTIALAGKMWAVPPMSARSIIAFVKVAGGLAVSSDMMRLGGDQLEKLYEAVHCGLHRAYPGLTFDAFMDMPVKPPELIDAFPVIGKAAGLEIAKVGEAAAAAAEPASN
jgi:hypothetical protein